MEINCSCGITFEKNKARYLGRMEDLELYECPECGSCRASKTKETE